MKTLDDSGRGRRTLHAGLGAGVLLALVLGWALLTMQDELTGQALEIFQTATLLVAAGLITQMVRWMRRHGQRIKARLHAEPSALTTLLVWLGYWTLAWFGYRHTRHA